MSEEWNPQKHKNMRRMAWCAFFLAALETAALLWMIAVKEPSFLNALGQASGLLWATYGTWTAMIGAYMGFSTARDGWAEK